MFLCLILCKHSLKIWFKKIVCESKLQTLYKKIGHHPFFIEKCLKTLLETLFKHCFRNLV